MWMASRECPHHNTKRNDQQQFLVVNDRIQCGKAHHPNGGRNGGKCRLNLEER